VRVSGLSADAWTTYRDNVALSAAEFPVVLIAETRRVVAMLRDDPHDGVLKVFEHIAGLAPDLRVALKPLATHYTEAKTIVATAHATVDLVEWVLRGSAVEIAAQYQHDGEFGLNGPFGARLIIAGKVEQLLPPERCTSDEIELMHTSNSAMQGKIQQWNSS
jgi:hypothetical protein